MKYRELIRANEALLQQYKKRRTMLGWARLLVFIIAAIAARYLFAENVLGGWGAVLAGTVAFVYFVFKDTDNGELIKYTERILFINKEELAIGAGNYKHRDKGSEFIQPVHAYANDLDLFGHASLYQYINRCTSAQGRELLAARLLKGSLQTGEIKAAQEAARELSPQVEWRQNLQEKGLHKPLQKDTEARIKDWLELQMPFSEGHWKILAVAFPLFSLGVLVLWIVDIIQWPVMSLAFTVFMGVGFYFSGKIMLVYAKLSKIVGEIKTLEHQLAHFEVLQVRSELLVKLKKDLQEKGKAVAGIKSLEGILNRFDFRLNIVVFIFLNSFLLWDLQQIIGLHKWVKNYGKSITKWIDIIAELEVLNTLANLRYNHPDWIFPALTDGYFNFNAIELGHPLIRAEKRVNNAFAVNGQGKVSIITGSNMGGKSTFLRSIGVNIVLAQIGAPVCAKTFELSPVQLHSSMRVADDLSESTSTFYAELKKLKSIIDEVKKGEQIFILLDEILRGTNSLDRHTGSDALIKQLIREQSVAIIATHDVELAALENEYPKAIENYHFDVQVAGEELYFDYKLKPGVCTSLNASILMKKIGIEI